MANYPQCPAFCKHPVLRVLETKTDFDDEIVDVRQFFLDEYGYLVQYFRAGVPRRACTSCGRIHGYPLDPRKYEKTDNGRPAEIALCRRAQGG